MRKQMRITRDGSFTFRACAIEIKGVTERRRSRDSEKMLDYNDLRIEAVDCTLR